MQKSTPGDRVLGLDVLRLTAMALVVLWHVASVFDLDQRHWLSRLNPGELGVTLFCGVSGFLAARADDAKPLAWLFRRLDRLYVSYWLVLPPIFVANAIVAYKPMTASLVVSEFLGTAGLTHPDQMVGIHLWFISLIVLCYALATVIRMDRRAWWLAAAGATLTLDYNTLFAQHVLSFLGGMAACRYAQRGYILACVALVLAVLAAGFRPPLAYPAVAVAALLLSTRSARSSGPLLAGLARLTYHFYLVHGPIYLALAEMLGLSPAADLLVGTFLSGAAAWCLFRVESFLRARGASLLRGESGRG
jgi:peptidoglycan/LPS O-acetylase OafA/YrhL